jgi:Patatin-like phospholipase
MTPQEGKNGFTPLFADVFQSELKYIQKRRNDLGLNSQSVVKEDKRLREFLEKSESIVDPNRVAPQTSIRPSANAELIGLALSGGGIRSATFNLGVLQGLARKGVLRCCDYISTVSGGGYIGSCLSSLLEDSRASVEEAEFPFRFQRKDKPDERKAVKHLREHGNFLAIKGSFLEYARMIGTYLSGLILTNLFTLFVLILLGWGVHQLVRIDDFSTQFMKWCFLVSLCSVVLMGIIRGISATWFREQEIKGRRTVDYINAGLAILLVVSAALGLVTLLAINWTETKSKVMEFLPGISIISALGLIANLITTHNKKIRGLLSAFFRVGWVLLLPVLLAWVLSALDTLNAYQGTNLYFTLLIAVLFLIASLVIDTNRISLHHFYRDRLSEAYIIKVDQQNKEILSNEPLRISELHEHSNGAPYHLINTTLNVPASKDRYLRGRGADLFFFSKKYVGSEVTGYRRTKKYDDDRTRLATAMAISGAAASPQMGTSTNTALRALMTLLNVRLNRWMPNPNPKFIHTQKVIFWPYYFIKEILGRSKEDDGLLNLSDGGHHENLGIYPLLKRRCRVIIASDASADPNFSMNDLANVVRKARIDLGVNIQFPELEHSLRLDPETLQTQKCYAIGDISYPDKDPDAAKGTLIYIKSTITENEPEDLLAYRRKHPSFPDQTTADQFFDEAQFESYRKLGEKSALKAFKTPFGNLCFSNEKLEEIVKEIKSRGPVSYRPMTENQNSQTVTPQLKCKKNTMRFRCFERFCDYLRKFCKI